VEFLDAEELHNIHLMRKYERELDFCDATADHLKEKKTVQKANAKEQARVDKLNADAEKARGKKLSEAEKAKPTLLPEPAPPTKAAVAELTLRDVEDRLAAVDKVKLESDEKARIEVRVWDWKRLPNGCPAVTFLEGRTDAPAWSVRKDAEGKDVLDADGDPIIDHEHDVYTVWIDGQMQGWQPHEPYVGGLKFMAKGKGLQVGGAHKECIAEERANHKLVELVVGNV
jgi:hypothetical protein